MQLSIRLRISGIALAMVLAITATAQEKKAGVKGRDTETVTNLLGGDADQWLSSLLESQVYAESNILVDRLSACQLSIAQLEKLVAAADAETSRDKRVQLWQAMRQTQDVKTRSHLIQVLLEEGAEMQIHFLNELENPGPFDVPILTALYKSQRARPKAAVRDQPRNANGNGLRSRQVQPSVPSTKSKSAEAKKVADLQSNLADADKRGDLEDLNDVSRKIVEIACHYVWGFNDAKDWFGWPHPGEHVPEETKLQWLKLMKLRSERAAKAQEQMISWLVKNGIEDEHRLMAFRMTAKNGWTNSNAERHRAKDLLDGLRSPESRAHAIPLIMDSISPHEFLAANEPEIVRLSAIENMHFLVTQSYFQILRMPPDFKLYRDLLTRLENSDPSPKVRLAAQRCLDRMTYCEQNYSKLQAAKK